MSGAKKKDKAGVGAALDVFKAGVDLLSDLRDSGKLQVFLAPIGSIRIIGDFRPPNNEPEQYAAFVRLKDEERQEVVREIMSLLSAVERIGDRDSAIQFLSRVVFDDAFDLAKKEGKSAEDQLREALGKKVAYAEEKLYTELIRLRSKRFETADRPCLEDVEFELVSARYTDPMFRTADSVESPSPSPYLLLRFRHSHRDKLVGIPFGFMARFMMGGQRASAGVETFDLECDESDIDLIIERLRDAKQKLIKARP